MGYVLNPDGLADKQYIMSGDCQIDIGGTLFTASATLSPMYDRKMLRVKA
ncbi:hypothetical protein [Marmoricola sp. URHB0036]|nr:hypothetical protein [Marmoricola sp. URHB0036]